MNMNLMDTYTNKKRSEGKKEATIINFAHEEISLEKPASVQNTQIPQEWRNFWWNSRNAKSSDRNTFLLGWKKLSM